MANLTSGTTWTLSIDPKVSSQTLTLPVSGTYIDRDIVVTINGVSSSVAQSKVGSGAFKANNTTVTIPSANISVGSTANSDGTYPITVASTTATTTSAATTSGYIASGASGTSGTATASGTGSVTGSTLSATSITPSTSDQTVTIGAGYYPSARTVIVKSLSNVTQSTATAEASIGDNTDSAGENKIILASGGALKISAGYVANDLYFSLAGLVPDTANITASTSSPYILSGKTAYDKDGALITGGIANLGNPSSTYFATSAGESGSKITAGKYVDSTLYVKSGTAGTPSASVTASVGSFSLATSGTNSGKYTATISGSNSTGATVTNSTGWITGGTKTGTATASGTAVLDAATCTISGGTVSATAGTASASASATSSGMTNGISSSATSFYVTATATASATGGSASITDVKDTHTAGYLPAQSATTVIAGSSKNGDSTGTKSDTKTVYLKAATLTHGDVSGTAGTVTKTVTGISTSTTDTGYKVTFSKSSGTITCSSTISAGYTEGDTKTATITATPTAPTDVYFATTSITNAPSLGGANTSNYNAPVYTATVSTSAPQVKLQGSATAKSVYNGTSTPQYINYYTGTYTLA